MFQSTLELTKSSLKSLKSQDMSYPMHLAKIPLSISAGILSIPVSYIYNGITKFFSSSPVDAHEEVPFPKSLSQVLNPKKTHDGVEIAPEEAPQFFPSIVYSNPLDIPPEPEAAPFDSIQELSREDWIKTDFFSMNLR